MDGQVCLQTLKVLLLIGVASGFGGLVSALTKMPADEQGRKEYREKYILPCPINPEKDKKLGFYGDVIIGCAGGICLFLIGLDSLFGLDVTESDNPQNFLRLVGLGLISGYMGSSILDGIGVMLGTFLLKKRRVLRKEREKSIELEERLRLSSWSSQMITLGEALKNWGKYEEALDLYDDALAADPKNADLLLSKAKVYSAKARTSKRGNDKAANFVRASKLVDAAIVIDSSCARAFYNKACYANQIPGSSKEEILTDLEKAVRLDKNHARLAIHDPDLENLRADPNFLAITRGEAL